MIVSGTSLTMTRGDTEILTLSLQNDDGSEVTLVDGDIVYFTVKINVNTAVKSFQKIIREFTDGKAVIRIEHDDTKNLPYGRYVYDIQLTRLNGSVTTVVKPSTFTLNSEVTYE